MSYTVLDFSESIDKVKLSAKPKLVLYACGEYGDCSEWSGAFMLELQNGKFALLSGYCDTTGWGCQDGADVEEFDSLEFLTTQGIIDLRENSYTKYPDLEAWDKDPEDLNRWIKAGMPTDRIWDWND